MKANRALVFVFVAILAVGFVACNDDDDDNDSRSVWDELDQEFGQLYQKEIRKILRENKWRESVGEVERGPKIQLDDDEDDNEERRSQRTVTGDSLPLPPGLSQMGKGFDWVTGASGRQVVDFNQKFRRRYYSPYTNTTYALPDEVFILNTPEVRILEQVDVFSTVVQFQKAKSKEFGINLSLYNDGLFKMSKATERMRGMLMEATSRVATTERLFTYYIMNMLPPDNVELTNEVQEWLSVLPAYDSSTKEIYARFFQRFGTHVTISAIFGGSMFLEDKINTRLLVDPSAANIRKQTSTYFKFRTEPNRDKAREIEARIDPKYSQSHTTTFTSRGGNTENFNPTQWQSWLRTIKTKPAKLRTRVLPIYEFINDDRVKRDIKKAMSDYASDLLKSPKTGAVSLTPKKNFAHYNEGARVEWTSSVSEKCRKKKVFIFWSKTVCEDRTNHQNLIKPTNSEPDSEWFMFGNNDNRQRVTIDLGQQRRLVTLQTKVARTGQDRQVWDFIRFYTSEKYRGAWNTSDNWVSWGKIGNDDDLPDILEQENEVTKAFPVKARYVHINFGPHSKQGGAGSRVFWIKALGVEETTNDILGHLEEVTENSVRGWTFNSFDPSRQPTVKIYANDRVIASGKPTLDRRDVQRAYDLPSDDKLGFEFPIELNGDDSYDVNAMFFGFSNKTRESTHYRVWSKPPPGKLMSASPTVVEGWAYNKFNPTRAVEIQIWVNGKLHASGRTGVDFPTSRALLKVEGNHGFRIPVNIRGAGVFNFVAYAIFNGEKRQLYNTLRLDNRFPHGVIEKLSATRVKGWAVDPARPNSESYIAVFIDNVRINPRNTTAFRTTLLRADVNEDWLVTGNHGFDIALRIQAGKVHEVAVYAIRRNGELAFIAKKLIALNVDDFASSPNSQNPLVSLLSAGYDAVYEEFRLPVVQFSYEQGLYFDNPYEDGIVSWKQPDQVFIMANPEVIIDEVSEIYNNTDEYFEKKAKTTGFSFGFFFGLFGSSQTTISVTNTLKKTSNVYATYDRFYKFFDAMLMPPCCGDGSLQMHQYAAHAIQQLPRYNKDSKDEYMRFIQFYGTHYLHKASFGGQISMQQVIDTSKLSDSSETFIKRQSGFTFGFIITLSFSSAHSDYSRRLTNEFKEASTHSVRYIGGNPEYFSMEHSSNWSRTIKDNPSLIQFELKEISELIDNERKRLDMHKAIVDYIESSAPPATVCRTKKNFATVDNGAKVLSYSSIAPRHTTDTLNNLLRSNKVAWTGSETGFIFAQNDDAQKIVVDLGQLRAISSIGVHLNPSGTSRGVWDFIRIRVSVDKSSWRDWKMIGKDDSKVDIKNYIYEVPKPNARNLRYIEISFGPAVLTTGLGARIMEITATGCVN
jgi:hypothetical protein